MESNIGRLPPTTDFRLSQIVSCGLHSIDLRTLFHAMGVPNGRNRKLSAGREVEMEIPG